MNCKLTRRELASLPREVIHEARNWTKADVSVAEWPPNSGQRVVIKDLNRCPLWFRMLAGRFFLRREWKALRALGDLPGVPDIIARPDADALVMEFRPGRRANLFRQRRSLGLDVVQQVEEITTAVHARGVTHGDLHTNNILVDDDGRVTLIDWATAHYFGPSPRGAQRLIFEEWKALDERAVAKFKVTRAPEEVSARQRDLLLRGSRFYRAAKRLRRGLELVRGRDRERERRSTRDKHRYILKKYYQPATQEAEDN